MSAESRFTPGTRVINAHGTRGTVNGYTGSNLSVATDGGGSSSGPAHFRAWRALTAEELRTETLQRFRIEHPAAAGDTVQQGHADACAEFGHGAWVIDGIRQPRCSRCGESTAELAPTAPGSAELRSFAVCRACGFTNGQHSPMCSFSTDTTAAQRMAADRADQAAARAAGATPDVLRAAAQGMAESIRLQGSTTTLGCTCGAASQTLTPYSFDERGRCDESTLWGLVRVIEHTVARDDRHSITVLVGA